MPCVKQTRQIHKNLPENGETWMSEKFSKVIKQTTNYPKVNKTWLRVIPLSGAGKGTSWSKAYYLWEIPKMPLRMILNYSSNIFQCLLNNSISSAKAWSTTTVRLLVDTTSYRKKCHWKLLNYTAAQRRCCEITQPCVTVLQNFSQNWC